MRKLIPFLREHFPYGILVLTLAFYPLIGVGQALVGIVNTTPIAIAYRAFYLLLALVVLLVQFPNLRRRSIPLAVVSLLLFWMVYTGRIVNDIVVEDGRRGYMNKGLFFFLTYGLGGCLAPALMAGLSAKTLNYRWLLRLLLFFFALCNLGLILFILIDNGFTVNVFNNRFRVGDSVVSPIALSQYGGALLITSASAWFIGQRKNLVYPSLIIFGLVMLVLGSSRGPLVAASLCVVLLLGDHFRIRVKSVTYWLYASVMLVVLAYFTTVVLIPNLERISIFNRVSATVDTGSGLDMRGDQWSSAWNQFLSNPVLGDSLIENAYDFYPHNFILEVLMSTGILGALTLLPAIGILVWKYFNRWDYEPEKRVYFYLFIFFFGCSMFSLSLITNAHVWILLALAASLPKKKMV